MYILEIEYSFKYYPEMDEQLFEMFGYSDGSGAGFGTRDHRWYFKTKKAAQKAYDKARVIRKIKSKIKEEDFDAID